MNIFFLVVFFYLMVLSYHIQLKTAIGNFIRLVDFFRKRCIMLLTTTSHI